MTAGLERFGALFCGGASRRMGRDKALLDWQGQSLLERGVDVLRAAGSQVFLACGSQARYAELGLPCVLDLSPGLGPLGGLEAALAYASKESCDPEHALLCVLACDMPHAKALVFDALCARLGQSDVCLLRTPAGVEPLFGVYRLGVLPAVRAALQAGERRMTAFHEGVQVDFLEASELPAGSYGANLNTPDEYREGDRS